MSDIKFYFFVKFCHLHSCFLWPDIFAIYLHLVVFHFYEYVAIPFHTYCKLWKIEIFLFAFLVFCCIVNSAFLILWFLPKYWPLHSAVCRLLHFISLSSITDWWTSSKPSAIQVLCPFHGFTQFKRCLFWMRGEQFRDGDYGQLSYVIGYHGGSCKLISWNCKHKAVRDNRRWVSLWIFLQSHQLCGHCSNMWDYGRCLRQIGFKLWKCAPKRVISCLCTKTYMMLKKSYFVITNILRFY